MLRAACGGVRPKHNDVRKLAVLGALDRHDEMAALLPETQTRTVAHELPHERGDLRSGESRLPMRAPQAIHAAEGLRDWGVSGQRRQKRAQVSAGRHFRQRDIGQQSIGVFVVVAVPRMRIRPEGRAVLARMLLGLKGIERSADNRVACIRA